MRSLKRFKIIVKPHFFKFAAEFTWLSTVSIQDIYDAALWLPTSNNTAHVTALCMQPVHKMPLLDVSE